MANSALRKHFQFQQGPIPFFVLATQNPIEMEGTYPLSEAKIDRLFLKLRVRYPAIKETRPGLLPRIKELWTICCCDTKFWRTYDIARTRDT
jgi:hypothetical protein